MIYQRFLDRKGSKQLYGGPAERYSVSTCSLRAETSNALDIDPGLDVDRRVIRNSQYTRIAVQVLVEG